jgi:nucleoside 2-deoxyribosyltransferase
MPTCFVIQPFDSGKFDKRFDDVYVPAIEAAGLEAYRVDRDPKVEVAIEAIEEGIRNAAVCLADITTDNPNVWYELGFAFAAGRPVVMVCSNERASAKYPFDIQHRAVINYKPESSSDFEELKATLCERIKAMLNKSEALRQIAEADQIAPTQGLSQTELMVLAILAGNTALPGASTMLHLLKEDSERSGLTAIGFSLAFRRLTVKKLAAVTEEWDENRDETYSTIQLTDAGWKWIESNESLFVLKKQPQKKQPLKTLEDDIPF